MALAYTRAISKTTCIGNSLSTINLNFSALDVAIVAVSANFNTKINFLSANIDNLRNDVAPNTAHWNETYTAVAPNSSNWSQGFAFYAFETSVGDVSADTLTTFALSNTAITLFDCSSFPTTALIPSNLNPKYRYTIKKTDSSTNALVLSSNLPVDGVFSYALTSQYSKLTFVPHNNAWWLI